jgi:hypothetical protein
VCKSVRILAIFFLFPFQNLFCRIDRRTIKAQCFPLYSILEAVGNPVIDLLSLDIEGAELEVIIVNLNVH